MVDEAFRYVLRDGDMFRGILYATIEGVAKLLRSREWSRRFLYRPFKAAFRRRLLTLEYMLYYSRERRRVREQPPTESEYVPTYPWTVGVIRDVFYNHEAYILACRERKVAYKTVDLFASDWIDQVKRSGCDAFVAWPSECIQEWKRLYDERLRFLTEDLGRLLYPSYDALWLYGSKQRQRDWLDIYGFPHAKTWVFYGLDEALDFMRSATLPVVAKVDIGAAAYGVRIIRSRREAERLIRRAFGRGIQGCCSNPQAWQWRHILLQEFVPDVREWRMIRIGDSLFGHEKGRRGDFHSGSGVVGWYDPPRAALDLLCRVTDAGGFRSLAMDVFEKPDGTLLVNEIQGVFGAFNPSQMYIGDIPGRYRLLDGNYVFEEGYFCHHACCGLRLDDLLRLLSRRTEGRDSTD